MFWTSSCVNKAKYHANQTFDNFFLMSQKKLIFDIEKKNFNFKKFCLKVPLTDLAL